MQLFSRSNKILEVLTFAMPLSANMFIQMFVNFASMYMVAQLGEKTLAAGALASSTYMTLSMMFLIFYSIGIMVSHQKGQENAAIKLGHIMQSGLLLACFLIIPASFIMWHADAILMLFHQDPELINITRSYFHYAALFLPSSLISMVMLQFFIGLGHPKISLFISTLTVPITLLLCYGLILGKLGLPKLALGGITAALSLTSSGVCLCLLIFILFAKRMQKYAIRKQFFKMNFNLMKQIISLGLPIGIQFGAELAAMAIATYFMGYFGQTALAASQLVGQYSLLVVMIILGLSQAVTVLCAQAYGKNEIEAIKEYVKAAIVILSLFFILISIPFIFYSHPLSIFFIGSAIAHQPNFMKLTTAFFIISLLILFADGIRNILSAGLRGLHDSRAPMTIGVICLWLISLPISYLIGFYFQAGPIGLRVGFSTGFILAVMLLIRRLNILLSHKKLNIQKTI